ncbi:shikimate kinase [Bacillus sp. AFS073361]|uniref:shikimate kinase n=1 Tax=Bacillus sp. AFS073361 TaxID=2033511 RepID=UPI000BFA073B|nr:shikimate kinase [Bacillus sp. AFS073361]PFP23572.1 shikimate kinase [Bacillus sp. AFS073361]
MSDKSIVFIGFMGVGKTTIGKKVATKLNREFIDIDEQIEKEYNMPVSQIFTEFGETEFRDREKSLIVSLAEQKQKVISVGGGAFLQTEIRETCLASCIVIFLELSLEAWKDRIQLIIDSRPVLQGKSMKEMEELYYKRQDIYKNHHLRISTNYKTSDEIADLIVNELISYVD